MAHQVLADLLESGIFALVLRTSVGTADTWNLHPCFTLVSLMKLTTTGLDDAPIRFKHLWGRYVNGFRPWKHCIQCLVSNTAKDVFPDMLDGSVELQDRLFYLCGVGQVHSGHFEKRHPELSRRMTNVHLAVRPRKGSVAAIGSAYGVTFVIQDAQSIPIETLP